MMLEKVVQNSLLYRVLAVLRQWGRHSIFIAFLLNERVQQVVVGMILLASTISVLGSNMNASIKFLSFISLFVLITPLIWSAANPLGRGAAISTSDGNTDRFQE